MSGPRIFTEYSAATADTSRTTISNALQGVINATPFAFDSSTRSGFIQLLLEDIPKAILTQDDQGRLHISDAPKALLALKSLGKNPSGSQALASGPAIRMLLDVSAKLGELAVSDSQLLPAAHEALRTIANCMLLHPQARSTFCSNAVGGGPAVLKILKNGVIGQKENVAPAEIFLAARLLFLASVSITEDDGVFIKWLVEGDSIHSATPSPISSDEDDESDELEDILSALADRGIVPIVAQTLDNLLPALLNGTPVAKDAMIDVLKVVFNLLVHYPKITKEQVQPPSDPTPSTKEKGKAKSKERSWVRSKSKSKKSAKKKAEGAVIGDLWSPRLNGLLPPLLRVFAALPLPSTSKDPNPLEPPLTHVIHSLITIPVRGPLHRIWLGDSASSFDNEEAEEPSSKIEEVADDSQKIQEVYSDEPEPIPASSSNGSASSNSARASPGNDSDSKPNTFSPDPESKSTPVSPKPKQGAMDRALSVLAAGKRSLSRSPSPLPGSASGKPAKREREIKGEPTRLGPRESEPIDLGFEKDLLQWYETPTRPEVDVVKHAYTILDRAAAYYLPDSIDPDSPAVRGGGGASGNRNNNASDEEIAPLESTLPPLFLLLTRLINSAPSNSTHPNSPQQRVRAWLVPPDLDRSEALEGRADLLGRCLRLMACVGHATAKDAAGEFLWAISGGDAMSLASLFGYGNVAGFLFNKGIMSAPPPPDSQSSSSKSPTANANAGRTINPITGTYDRPTTTVTEEMTEEEKEREAEKLFVLFDRLERSGAMRKEDNPIRKAAQEGKLG